MLEIIGIIAIFIILKFVYDTYLTNNTEEEWQKYKKSNPIDAHMLEMEEKNLDLQEAKRQYNLSVKHFDGNPEKSKKALEKAIQLDPENDNYQNLLNMLHTKENEDFEEDEIDSSKISNEFTSLKNAFKNDIQGQILLDSDKEFLFETIRELDFNPFTKENVEMYYHIKITFEEKNYYLKTIELYKAGNEISKSYSPKISIEPKKTKTEYIEIIEKSFSSIKNSYAG